MNTRRNAAFLPNARNLRAVCLLLFATTLLLPFSVYAQTVRGILEKIGSTVQAIILLLFAIAVTIFIVGAVRFVAASASEEGRRSAKNLVIYGIIGLFIATSVWGLSIILLNTFGLPDQDVQIPGAPEARALPAAERVIDTVLAEVIVPFLNLLIAAATALFIWGVIEFMANADNEAARKKGAQHMVWGIVGLAIMISSRGILALLGNFISSL